MEWFEELHKPEIGLLCAGGHFTMDMERAAFAAKKYFNFKSFEKLISSVDLIDYH